MSSIVKVYKFDSGFELIPRETLQDKRLSLQALGLLVNICSYPENWTLNKTELYKRFEKNKETSVRTAWNELLEADYVMEKRERDGKKWRYEYAVRIVPFTQQEKIEFLGTGFSRPQNEDPKMKTPKSSGNRIHKKKNTQEKNTQEKNTQKDDDQIDQIYQKYKNQISNKHFDEVLDRVRNQGGIRNFISYLERSIKDHIKENPIKPLPEWIVNQPTKDSDEIRAKELSEEQKREALELLKALGEI